MENHGRLGSGLSCIAGDTMCDSIGNVGSADGARGEVVHRTYGIERVRYDGMLAEMLSNELEKDPADRIFLVVAPQMAHGGLCREIQDVLGERVCGLFSEIPAHVPFESLMRGVDAVAASGAQRMVVLGGGSAIDMAKLMSLCLAFNIRDWEGLAGYADLGRFDPSRRLPAEHHWIRSIAIPSTLSAAEFTWFAGVTDTQAGSKRVVGHPMMIPMAVIYDPRSTVDVPLPLFLASGIKAVDHAVERLASLQFQPFSDAVGTQALQMLARALPCVARAPGELAARRDCQLAGWLSISGGMSGVRVGASHAIGHMLGPHAGIAHGLTSCTILPAVMRWNLCANSERQALVSAALGRPGEQAAEVIEDLVRSLGLPTRLRDVGVKREALPALARKTMEDSLVHHNPRTIRGADDVLEILELAY